MSQSINQAKRRSVRFSISVKSTFSTIAVLGEDGCEKYIRMFQFTDADDYLRAKHIASVRYRRNHKLMAETFSDSLVPDGKMIVTEQRINVGSFCAREEFQWTFRLQIFWFLVRSSFASRCTRCRIIRTGWLSKSEKWWRNRPRNGRNWWRTVKRSTSNGRLSRRCVNGKNIESFLHAAFWQMEFHDRFVGNLEVDPTPLRLWKF